MTVNYKWKISDIERLVSVGEYSDVIKNIHWRLIGSDGDYSADVYGSVDVPTDSLDDSFVPFSDLSGNTIVSWVKDVLGEESFAKYKSTIQEQIENDKTPIIIKGLMSNTEITVEE